MPRGRPWCDAASRRAARRWRAAPRRACRRAVPVYSVPSNVKRQRRVAVDAPAGGQPKAGAHAITGLGCADPVDGDELVGGGVADGVEPAPAAGRMAPALGEAAPSGCRGRTGTRPTRASVSAVRVGRVGDVRLAAVVELGLVARPAPRAVDQQHGLLLLSGRRAAAPCSSTSAPVVNRSSANGAFSGCGSSWAIVCAKHQPAPGWP